MAINGRGKTVGSVSGGCIEDDLIRRIREGGVQAACATVTHDPKLDDLVLIDALQSDAFYVGAIGSRRHSELRKTRLHEHFDLSHQTLDALHGPAGLYIGSKTPAEIALSIMAEVVAVKNGVGANAVVPVAAGKARLDQPEREAFTAPVCAV